MCQLLRGALHRDLGEKTGLPVVHLDQHFWNDGWIQTPRNRWEEKVDRLIASDQWVIDGNYGGTMEARLARADTIHFLDFESGEVTEVFRKAGPFRHRWIDVSPDEEWIIFAEQALAQSELMLVENSRRGADAPAVRRVRARSRSPPPEQTGPTGGTSRAPTRTPEVCPDGVA